MLIVKLTLVASIYIVMALLCLLVAPIGAIAIAVRDPG